MAPRPGIPYPGSFFAGVAGFGDRLACHIHNPFADITFADIKTCGELPVFRGFYVFVNFLFPAEFSISRGILYFENRNGLYFEYMDLNILM